ncbi:MULTISPECIES: hypothetical protein [unclassified Isoptericola]|uniref:hypothetical protein n=1 Tax=unclassified Isoptericola TaxID=2623355 RepID=UPI0037AB80F1|nr:hypothetical protein [Isoptericola sp. QY 916]
MSTAMRRVLANPSVTPLLVVTLVVTGLFLWYHLGRDAWRDWQRDRAIAEAARWSPEPWGLTADEFPGHDATALPVDTSRMTTRRQPGWSVSAVMHDPLGPLFAGDLAGVRFATTGDRVLPWTDREDGLYPVDATSGVDVDGVQVITFVTVSPDGPYTLADQGSTVWQLQYEAESAAEHGLHDDSLVWNPGGTVRSVQYVGRLPDPAERYRIELDELGPVGLTTQQRGADGEEFRTTSLATVAEGALVSVGVLVPDGVDLPADLEPAVLLERLADEVRADPPSFPATDGTTSGAQAESRTTREVGSVIAAGS